MKLFKKNSVQKIALAGAFLAMATGMASAATDIAGVIDTVSGYWDAVSAVAIVILLFILGRRVARKL